MKMTKSRRIQLLETQLATGIGLLHAAACSAQRTLSPQERQWVEKVSKLVPGTAAVHRLLHSLEWSDE